LFETRIWSCLRTLRADLPVFVESESRKVGDLRVPDALIEAMREAPCVRVDLSLTERVKLLRAEYEHFEAQPQALLTQLDCLVALHGRARIDEWKALAASGAWDALVERLLQEHYDPAYLRSINRNFVRVEQAHVVTLAQSTPQAYESAARLLAGETMR
jgi:tRNA 2-selenouridine synthase